MTHTASAPHPSAGTPAAPSTGPSTGPSAGPSAGRTSGPRRLQPWLHDLVVALAPPVQLWCGPDGAVRGGAGDGGGSAQGLWCGDVRVLSHLVLTAGGAEPSPVLVTADGAGGQLVVAAARLLGDDAPDPTARLEQRRRVTADGLEERVSLRSSARTRVRTRVQVHLRADLLGMDAVKAGRTGPDQPPAATAAAAGDRAGARWERDGVVALVTAPGADVAAADPGAPGGAGAVLAWDVDLPPGGCWSATWSLRARDAGAVVAAAPPAGWPEQVQVASGDQRLARWVARSLQDLEALRMTVRGGGGVTDDGVFVAAGAPWYFTLFGRDALWTARMLLPLGTDLAASTLRVLADRQGAAVDPATDEEPGKVLHELRRTATTAEQAGGAALLPPVYYGTVDATSLWVCLLHDAWRWGLPLDRVRPLLPHLEAALAWQEGAARRGGGFLRYAGAGSDGGAAGAAPAGLANQGWKDSGDAVQWRDGRLATGPLALCEVQGYAHEAAVGGAALLDACGRPGGDRWRAWAGELADRFRTRFWVGGALGPLPAVALDGRGAAVDAVTSNPGHLLGTGLLDAGEEALVAARLLAPDLAGGRGLRTMSSLMAGYSPLSYHGGSVWTHDTAIAVAGAARAGQHATAVALTSGLLDAAEAFAYRVPELHGGDARDEAPAPVPYPASCRPQAWSAASSVAVLVALLGLRPDVPAGRLHLAPAPGAPLGALDVAGLRVAGLPLAVAVDAAGAARASGPAADALSVVTATMPRWRR